MTAMTEADAKDIVKRYEDLVAAVSCACGGEFDDGEVAITVVDGELSLVKIVASGCPDGIFSERVIMPWSPATREALGRAVVWQR